MVASMHLYIFNFNYLFLRFSKYEERNDSISRNESNYGARELENSFKLICSLYKSLNDEIISSIMNRWRDSSPRGKISPETGTLGGKSAGRQFFSTILRVSARSRTGHGDRERRSWQMDVEKAANFSREEGGERERVLPSLAKLLDDSSGGSGANRGRGGRKKEAELISRH